MEPIVARLSVIVRLGRATAPVAAYARHGMWSLRYGRAAAPFLAELVEGDATAETLLVCEHGDGDEARVLYRSISKVDPISLNRSRNPAYWRGAQLFARALRRLHAGQLEPLGGVPDEPQPILRPTNATAVVLLARIAARALRRRVEMILTHEQWLLAYRRTGPRRAGDEVA